MRTIKLFLAAVATVAALCSGAWAGTIINDLNNPSTWDTAHSPYTVEGSVTIDDRITVTGSVTLILTDGCTLTANRGIRVGPGNSLTITTPSAPDGTGVLIAQTRLNPGDEAAIGGNEAEDCGTITINGGTVRASAIDEWWGNMTYGAGIGGGGGIGGVTNAGAGGTITINGGTVEAYSLNGAAIGGGYSMYGLGGAGGNITINGGKVTATAEREGAGIGGGPRGAGGTITISGGTVTARSSSGAGIGGGRDATDHGTLSSGPNGWAWMTASSVGADMAGFVSGVLFNGNDGRVYGSATVSGDVAIPSGKTLEIPSGKTLTIKQGSTLDATDNGTIVNKGALTNDGILKLAPTSTPKSDIPALGLRGSGRVWIDGRWYSNSGLAYGKIEVTYGSGGTASASASQDVLEGTAITLTASPDIGYELDEWEVKAPTTGLTIPSQKITSFNMPNSDVEIKATFKKIRYNITVNDDGHGSGTPSPDVAASGDTVTLIASPDAGYMFDKWEPVTPAGLVITNDKFTMPNRAVTVKATFKALPPQKRAIIVDNDGNGTGRADPTSAASGDIVKIILSPNDGYEFDKWTDISPSSLMISSNDTFTMPDEPVSVKATFKKKVHAITVTYDLTGTASADRKEASSDDVITLSYSPNLGYQFVSWTDVKPTWLVISGDTFTMPDEAVEVKATFKPAPTPPQPPSPSPAPAPTPDPPASFVRGKYNSAGDTLWDARVGGDLTIYIDVELAKFANAVSLDGVSLAPDDFGVRDGSTIVTIWEKTLREHMKTDGEHEAEIIFDDGSAIHTFAVRGMRAPRRMDHSHGGLCASGSAVLVAIAALAMISRRRK